MKENSKADLLAMLPKDGFIRLGKAVELSSKERVILIRKANELWQKGDILAAERIFITVHYADGLIRLGEHYYEKQDFIKSLMYYKLAKDEKRVEAITLKMAEVIRTWLKDETK